MQNYGENKHNTLSHLLDHTFVENVALCLMHKQSRILC